MSRRPRASSTEPENANLLLLDEETAVLVVRGACHVRTASGKLERVSAGGMVVRNARHERDRRITRALELLQATPEKRWTVERLARAVGLSRAVFARRFSEQTGTSPLRHLTELRLALAATVLTDEPEVKKEGLVVANFEVRGFHFEVRRRKSLRSAQQVYGFDEIARLRRERR